MGCDKDDSVSSNEDNCLMTDYNVHQTIGKSYYCIIWTGTESECEATAAAYGEPYSHSGEYFNDITCEEVCENMDLEDPTDCVVCTDAIDSFEGCAD